MADATWSPITPEQVRDLWSMWENLAELSGEASLSASAPILNRRLVALGQLLDACEAAHG